MIMAHGFKSLVHRVDWAGVEHAVLYLRLMAVQRTRRGSSQHPTVLVKNTSVAGAEKSLSASIPIDGATYMGAVVVKNLERAVVLLLDKDPHSRRLLGPNRALKRLE